MISIESRLWRVLGLAVLVTAAAIPAQASGFLIFEQGTKAMGMAGAFTAQADDGSALFHNAGGIGFMEEREFYLGGTWVSGAADFEGAAPFPGQGVKEKTEDLSELVPHFYWVEPLGERWAFGLGLNAPFGLSVEWADKDTFTGRHINTRSALTAIDLNPTVGWRATDNLSLGLGIVARFSEVELSRRQFQQFPGVPPSHPAGTEWASSTLEGGRDEGFGFNLGILHKYNNSFSWGFQYRSRMEIDYGGELVLTQIPTGIPPIDGGLAQVIPFGQVVPGAASIEFPDIASLGLGFAFSANTWFEFDLNWTGWSTFDQLVISIDGPSGPDGTPIIPDVTLDQNWSDAWQYRFGFRWNSSEKMQWRLGYLYDETPQPEETVSPVLPDANRNDFTFGFGYMGGGFNFDLAIMYVKFDSRTVETSEVFYFGEYSQDAWLLAASIGF